MAYKFFNPNPYNKRVGDCSVRALCKELEHAPKTYQNMQKLATFYSIYDHYSCNRSKTRMPTKYLRS